MSKVSGSFTGDFLYAQFLCKKDFSIFFQNYGTFSNVLSSKRTENKKADIVGRNGVYHERTYQHGSIRSNNFRIRTFRNVYLKNFPKHGTFYRQLSSKRADNKKPTTSAEREYIMRELISTGSMAVIISAFALYIMSI